MNDEIQDSSSLEQRIWKEIYDPVLSTIYFTPHSNMLFVGFKQKSLINHFKQLAPKGHLSYAQYNPVTEILSTPDTALTQENIFDFIFGLGIRKFFLYDPLLLLQALERVIKPSGMVLFTLVNHSSSLDSYTKTIETGDFPTLKYDTADAFEDFIGAFLQAVENCSFSLHSNKNIKGFFELNNPDVFEAHLRETTFLYKPVMSDETNEEVIKRQVELFKRKCETEHAGKYLYNYDVTYISLLK